MDTRLALRRRVGLLGLLTMALAIAAVAGLGARPADGSDRTDKDKDAKDRKPSIVVKVTPPMSMTPARVTATAELKGGADDYEDYYCPTIEWEWGDETKSEQTIDCTPFEAGKSQIRRRFTGEHTYQMSGNYRVQFRMKRANKVLGGGSATLQVRAGIREQSFPPF